MNALKVALKLDVMAQTLDCLGRKVLVQAEVVKAAQGAVKAAVVDDGLGLVEADVGVAA